MDWIRRHPLRPSRAYGRWWVVCLLPCVLVAPQLYCSELEDKFIMKNHSVAVFVWINISLPPSQSSPISNLPCSIHSRRSQLSLLKLVNLFLNLGRESIGGHCSPAHSITNAQNPQSGELGPPLSIFLKTKISPAESERKRQNHYQNKSRRDVTHGSSN